MLKSPELDRLVESVRRIDPDSAEPLITAVTAARAPLRIQIAGRAGVGKSTVARALRIGEVIETSAVDTPGVDDPVLDGDLVIYVLAGSLHDADRNALASVPPGRALVLLNKADAVGSWPAALAQANNHTRTVGVRTIPVVASTAIAAYDTEMKPAELSSLRTLAGVADPSLTLSNDLFTSADVVVDARARRTMLERWELQGLDSALAALRHDSRLTVASLVQIMYASSGIEEARAAVLASAGRLATLRGGPFLDSLETIAARDGAARDTIEHFLRGEEAAQIGLEAALACPDLADVIAEHGIRPVDANEALQLAGWWQTFADGPIGAPSKRAARRLHRGYSAAWQRMARHAV